MEYLYYEWDDGECHDKSGAAWLAWVLILIGTPGNSPVDQPDEIGYPGGQEQIIQSYLLWLCEHRRTFGCL